VRVLHVMECTIGGTRRHLVDVALGQRALGLDVHVTAAVSRQPDFESDLQRLERAGVVVTRLAMVRAIAPLKDARHLTALRRQLERVRPDIVHTHASKAGVLGRLASIQSDVGKRVHTPHTFAFLFEAEFSRPKRALFRCVERALASHTHAMIAVSASEARTFTESEVVDRERVRIVQNGIDARGWIEAIPIDRAALGVVGEDLLVLVIGLLNVAKGQDIALSALAKPGLDDVHIAIVGHGDMESQLRGDASRLGIEKRVHFLGFRTDVPRLVAACDFVLLPSRWEGMPYVVLEAMAGAKPVVATPVDGAVDLVSEGRTGFVARAIDAGAVAEALRAMSALTSRERAAMGSVGRARVLEHHGVDAMVKQLVDVYEEVR